MQGYFRRNGFPVRELTEREEVVVADYCGRGFNYFVFDLVRPGRVVGCAPFTMIGVSRLASVASMVK